MSSIARIKLQNQVYYKSLGHIYELYVAKKQRLIIDKGTNNIRVISKNFIIFYEMRILMKIYMLLL